MAQVLEFKRPIRAKKTPIPMEGGFSFTEGVDKDLTKLSSSLGISKEEAIQVATDFYRKYPMLMELVRSPEHLLRN